MYIYKYIYIFRKSEKRKVYPPFKDNIWGADIAVMQWISRVTKVFQFVLCVIDTYSKYAWNFSFERQKWYYNY